MSIFIDMKKYHKKKAGKGIVPWKRDCRPTLVFLTREFHGQKNLVGYSPWSHKELDMTEQLTDTNIETVCFNVRCNMSMFRFFFFWLTTGFP